MTGIELVEARASALLHELQSELDRKFDNDIAAKVALLQIMPFGEDAQPLALVTAVLAEDPRHGLANLVDGYLALYYTMSDENLERAANNLELLIAAGIEVAAASLQLGEIKRMLDLDAKFAVTTDLMRAAIVAEPTWALGHLQLAWAMREEERFDEARKEYDRAIARLIDGDDLPPLEWSYAACFTGQLSDRDHLKHERDALPSAR